MARAANFSPASGNETRSRSIVTLIYLVSLFVYRMTVNYEILLKKLYLILNLQIFMYA